MGVFETFFRLSPLGSFFQKTTLASSSSSSLAFSRPFFFFLSIFSPFQKIIAYIHLCCSVCENQSKISLLASSSSVRVSILVLHILLYLSFSFFSNLFSSNFTPVVTSDYSFVFLIFFCAIQRLSPWPFLPLKTGCHLEI